ncbi:MAG: TetR/AcrR family transcriptional regulator [Solirubrobacteraceae bacterium]|nr:TetR/AcrR family transcriptional regulator [Solirubrobacteraceae bacterium]
MTKPRPAADYRQRLIDALAVVIIRDGFVGAKIQDVVKEARVSLRTFYAEFPNKEACFLELYSQQHQVVLDMVARDLDFSQPWKLVMRQGFERYFTALSLYPRLTHAVTIELATLSQHAREIRQNHLDQFVLLMIDLVEQGRAANPDIPARPLTPLMARAIIGGVIELVFNHMVRDEADRLPELVDTSTDMLWSVVTAVDDAGQ